MDNIKETWKIRSSQGKITLPIFAFISVIMTKIYLYLFDILDMENIEYSEWVPAGALKK